jgi:hypothetical protein
VFGAFDTYEDYQKHQLGFFDKQYDLALWGDTWATVITYTRLVAIIAALQMREPYIPMALAPVSLAETGRKTIQITHLPPKDATWAYFSTNTEM